MQQQQQALEGAIHAAKKPVGRRGGGTTTTRRRRARQRRRDKALEEQQHVGDPVRPVVRDVRFSRDRTFGFGICERERARLSAVSLSIKLSKDMRAGGEKCTWTDCTLFDSSSPAGFFVRGAHTSSLSV